MNRTGIFLCEESHKLFQIYANRSDLPCDEKIYTKQDVLADADGFANTEFIFSSWGMPHFSEEEIKKVFPALKAVFYAAGTVQGFAAEFLHCGVKVYSAWAANAIPVAEYTLAQILLSSKGFFALSSLQSKGEIVRAEKIKESYPGNFDITVGIIGAGMIGRRVLALLNPFRIKALVYDAFLSAEEITSLGGEKADLEDIFQKCEVISNHLANKEQTKGILNGALFAQMKPYATFINTGRGAQVVEKDLAEVLRMRPDLTALLDVTYPEPPAPEHPFYILPNCFLTPHIAGSSGREVARMGEYMMDAYKRFVGGIPCAYEVSCEMLKTMA